jgi:geranylgeranyl pyrophosphate synthase
VSATAQPIAQLVTSGLRNALGACELRLGIAVADGLAEVAVPGAATLAAGGKRLRPLLVFCCAGSRHDPGEAVVRAAASVELVHMATLVHDDLLDGATMRRGRETIASSHGAAAAIQVGDYLFARAFAELAGADEPAAIEVLAAAALDLSQGELAQGRAAFDIALSETAYVDRVRCKTASLFASACRLGAMLGGASADVQDRLAAFGEAVGMAFQIFDDILDLTGSSAATGKRRGADLRDGTVTLPMIYAIQDEPDLASAIRSTADDLEIDRLCDRLVGHIGVTRARERALLYVADARRVLDGPLDGADRTALVLVADGVVDRYS